jgi:hypothetical protein
MKAYQFIRLLKKMLIKLTAVLWPLWWVILPFLFFYADQFAVFIQFCSVIF